ncbi:hypothetical protein ACT3CE_10435 [Marinifilum sp. RC60d5]|uniref:hypothetical protein n=1 Tax=Marinifilum sp. RC60d5 TaxID=3458414 RepID=UPI004036512B
MKTKFYQIVFLCIAFIGMANVVSAQTLTGDPYDTFNRSSSITQTANVTLNSVRQYTIPGDATVASASTFVWKIKGGVFVTDADGAAILDPATTAGLTDNGDGTLTYTLLGDASKESSVFVKWSTADATSYVAVYEETAFGCYNSANPFRGFQISVTDQLEIWLADAAQADICSGDEGTVRIELPANSGAEAANYYPMTINYSVTDKDGDAITGSPFTLTLATADVEVGTDAEAGRYFYTINRGVLTVADVTIDDFYTITLESVTDAFKATGVIVDDAPNNKYPSHKINVRHLPQTNTMVQN